MKKLFYRNIVHDHKERLYRNGHGRYNYSLYQKIKMASKYRFRKNGKGRL